MISSAPRTQETAICFWATILLCVSSSILVEKLPEREIVRESADS